MQLKTFPTEESLAEAYGEAESFDYVEEVEGQRRTARKILGQIEGFTEKGALLDLGCWVGFLVDEAERRGWSATGVEPSEFASRYARSELGLDVRNEDLLRAELPGNHFAAVFMGDVIEHLNDPASAIDRVAEVLAPGGIFGLTLPDAGSRVARVLGARWWSVIPTHVQYFNKSGITTLLQQRGFEVVAVSTSPKSFSVTYYADRLSGYSKLVARAVRSVVRLTRLGQRQWAPDFGDRMLVIARHKGS